MNMCVHLFIATYVFEYLFLILLGVYLGVELLGHMAALYLTWRSCRAVFIAAASFYIPPAMYKGLSIYF